MPARFHLVSPAIWGRELRRASRDAQVLAFYVATCRVRTSEGCYELAVGHVTADTGMAEGEVLAAFDELDAAGLVTYDADAEVVLERYALKHNPLPASDNRLTGAVRRVQAMASSPLKGELYRLAVEHSPAFADALGLAMPDLTHDPFPTPSEGSQDPGDPWGGMQRVEPRRVESSGQADPPTCGTCGKPALVKANTVQVDAADQPWCGWCDGTKAAS